MRDERPEAIAAELAGRQSRMGKFSRERFLVYLIWHVIALAFCVVFGGFIAMSFLHWTEKPAYASLVGYIDSRFGPEQSPEVLEALEKDFGPRPEVAEDSREVSGVRAAFRTGNLPKDAVHFTQWGPPVPYHFEGVNYWAVPFRYEADFGFGSVRQDTATALIRDGKVCRFLFVPFWNFLVGH